MLFRQMCYNVRKFGRRPGCCGSPPRSSAKWINAPRSLSVQNMNFSSGWLIFGVQSGRVCSVCKACYVSYVSYVPYVSYVWDASGVCSVCSVCTLCPPPIPTESYPGDAPSHPQEKFIGPLAARRTSLRSPIETALPRGVSVSQNRHGWSHVTSRVSSHESRYESRYESR